MLSTTIELRRMVVAMYEEQFSKRLTELRTQKGVSARDMSLSIGQNPGYIRAIESGTAFPTMANFSTLLHKNFLISARKPPME